MLRAKIQWRSRVARRYVRRPSTRRGGLCCGEWSGIRSAIRWRWRALLVPGGWLFGHDAIRETPDGDERIQIKGRAFDKTSKRSQRIGKIKAEAACDKAILVLLDNATLEPVEMWEAAYEQAMTHLKMPGSKARSERGSMSVNAFKKIAQAIWP
jgi:hypothetical protein